MVGLYLKGGLAVAVGLTLLALLANNVVPAQAKSKQDFQEWGLLARHDGGKVLVFTDKHTRCQYLVLDNYEGAGGITPRMTGRDGSIHKGCR